jgi:hypothetical protein
MLINLQLFFIGFDYRYQKIAEKIGYTRLRIICGKFLNLGKLPCTIPGANASSVDPRLSIHGLKNTIKPRYLNAFHQMLASR